ncbi:NlpC/P60 family protein [Leucobacter sp. W1478]|uniref:NlpC/P60 family protein n=1 Tax=Leucobacter sp. W1478 TaxID=3439065 RepID=UPI003F40E9A0
MTQHTGTLQASGTEVVAQAASAPRTRSLKHLARMVGAGALSVGMVGVFALPAYAAPDTSGMPDGFAMAAESQSLLTEDGADALVPVEAVAAEVSSVVLAQEQAAEEAARVAEEAARTAQATGAGVATATAARADVPSGAGAAGIVSAAYAQLGQFQDCTALVERSLRAVGIPAGDLGTRVGEHTALGGTLVTDGAYAPGDVLIWSGVHSAIYIGNGQAVHSGYNGNQTVVASAFLNGAPSGVVRF